MNNPVTVKELRRCIRAAKRVYISIAHDVDAYVRISKQEALWVASRIPEDATPSEAMGLPDFAEWRDNGALLIG